MISFCLQAGLNWLQVPSKATKKDDESFMRKTEEQLRLKKLRKQADSKLLQKNEPKNSIPRNSSQAVQQEPTPVKQPILKPIPAVTTSASSMSGTSTNVIPGSHCTTTSSVRLPVEKPKTLDYQDMREERRRIRNQNIGMIDMNHQADLMSGFEDS